MMESAVGSIDKEPAAGAPQDERGHERQHHEARGWSRDTKVMAGQVGQEDHPSLDEAGGNRRCAQQ